MDKRLRSEAVSVKEMKITEKKAASTDQASCLSVQGNEHFHFLIPLFSAGCLLMIKRSEHTGGLIERCIRVLKPHSPGLCIRYQGCSLLSPSTPTVMTQITKLSSPAWLTSDDPWLTRRLVSQPQRPPLRCVIPASAGCRRCLIIRGRFQSTSLKSDFLSSIKASKQSASVSDSPSDCL